MFNLLRNLLSSVLNILYNFNSFFALMLWTFWRYQFLQSWKQFFLFLCVSLITSLINTLSVPLEGYFPTCGKWMLHFLLFIMTWIYFFTILLASSTPVYKKATFVYAFFVACNLINWLFSSNSFLLEHLELLI